MTGSDTFALVANGVTHIPAVRLARRFHERLFGLMGRAPLPPGAALWLRPCRGIHTFGMRFAIDVLFLDARGHVLRLARAVRPWRLVWAPRGTRSVVELTAGWMAAEAIRVGDTLESRPGSAISSSLPAPGGRPTEPRRP